MRKLNDSSHLCSRLLRGLALGFCFIMLVYCVMPVNATELVEDISGINDNQEVEDKDDGDYDNSDSPLGDDNPDIDIGEDGPDDPEDEVEDAPAEVGCTCAETLISFFSAEMMNDDDIVIYEDLNEFEASTALVDRYQYELIKRLEFLQYSQVIMIGLIFVLIFKKK